MTDDQTEKSPASTDGAESSPLDELLRRDDADDASPTFPAAFRGYDREAVDDAVRHLVQRARAASNEVHREKLRAEAMYAQQRADHDDELAEAARRHVEETGRLQEQARAAAAR
ncbi:MAG: cell division initiation protein, partial [Microbacterium sp.]|nr:cell division initiation protein [Microbacterium sp.]